MIYIYIFIYKNVLYKIVKCYLRWVVIKLIQLNEHMHNSHVDIE